ncbi:hypothetical protein E1B28_005442 [Marasmius oreades]|uniref:Glycoside hydrolase family 44 catalytic domain-containing protein n=1 Tax=Marasmius oreades TaxID=181124 RepID=A0A9P7S532_9AGAR|nr:uncharacterized protein E1B28_005442 [Marasmius oreades]KAG7094618.1 hypothetical protein E1B28_005442 [Marasmius oreades]
MWKIFIDMSLSQLPVEYRTHISYESACRLVIVIYLGHFVHTHAAPPGNLEPLIVLVFSNNKCGKKRLSSYLPVLQLAPNFDRSPITYSLRVTALQLAKADLTVYENDALGSGWENWSWGSTIDFAAKDIFDGTSSVSVTSDAYSGLSVKLEGTFPQYAGLRFDISGAQPDVQIYFSATDTSAQSPSIPISAISKEVTANGFTSLLIDFKALPGTGATLPTANWDRITFQAGGNGASYHLDNIIFVDSIVVVPQFLSAEPLASNLLAVTTVGAVNLKDIVVKLNGKALSVSSTKTYSPPDTPSKTINYLALASPFTSGSLVITAGNSTFGHTIPAAQSGSIATQGSLAISPLIYGVNFPTDANYIKTLGVTFSRWGGNTATSYNPNGDFINAGADWYFENRGSDKADDWLGWVNGAGSSSLMTVPALDWVAKDNSSYSYPKTLYPDQQAFDPFNADAGNGKLPDGTPVSPATEPNRSYTTWNPTLAKQWLSSLKNKPAFIAIDNEIEIAHSTHQDMHSQPINYDEELKRIVDFATVAKQALPSAKVVAPSTCAWWFYWTSSVGWDDTAAHGNIDFLPWFLQQMAKHDRSTGTRLLDYLDIHYYFQGDTSANDAAAKAIRLRMTRSLWDPTYVDDSWVGQEPQQNHQPNPTKIQLIPRMKSLIAQNYPGTKLSISEWSSTNDQDITGGLVTVDMLGIFGKYGLDAATYWATPDQLGPVGLAYWLFRGNNTFFGSSSVQVSLSSSSSPDTVSVYAGTQNSKLSVVIINKSPSAPLSYKFSNFPAGTYFIRHFGGGAGVAKWQTETTLKASDFLVVPPYTAIFLLQK